MSTELTGVIAEHFTVVNAFGIDAIVATFAEDAYVNDAHREINGREAIRRWVAKETAGDKVALDVQEVIDITTATSSSGPPTTAGTTRPACPARWSGRTTSASGPARS